MPSATESLAGFPGVPYHILASIGRCFSLNGCRGLSGQPVLSPPLFPALCSVLLPISFPAQTRRTGPQPLSPRVPSRVGTFTDKVPPDANVLGLTHTQSVKSLLGEQRRVLPDKSTHIHGRQEAKDSYKCAKNLPKTL